PVRGQARGCGAALQRGGRARRGARLPPRRRPFVARGSGTGLSGGALPVAEGVLIALSRMRRVLEVDLADRRVMVEPGVMNLDVPRALGPTHFFPPDPSG